MTQAQLDQGCWEWAHSQETLDRAEECRQILDDWLYDSKSIYNDKGKELTLSDDEYFVPCFDPEIPVRRELPVEWFVSNFGNLVSIQKDGTVMWLPPKDKGKGDKDRKDQKWQHRVTGRLKSIPHYVLLALVFNKKAVVGYAKKMLEDFGSYALGRDSIYSV